VAEEVLEFLPPHVFRASLSDIREKLNKLSEDELANVIYFPHSLVRLRYATCSRQR
jgi:hypothetical protein